MRTTQKTRSNEEIAVEVVSARRVRAAKDHTCSDCGGKISAGQNYWRGFLLVAGEPTVIPSHSPYQGACLDLPPKEN